MAKFPTEVTESVVVPVALAGAYVFFWDVPTSARCIPGLDRCETSAGDVDRFVFAERSTGPVSMCVTYTARYKGLIKSFVQGKAAKAASDYLANVTRVLGGTRA
jgi:hypothetical protein